MILAALDAAYGEDLAAGGCILFRGTDAKRPLKQIQLRGLAIQSPYRRGALYKRELWILLELLARAWPSPDVIIVDGYAVLSKDGAPGLGAHLYGSLFPQKPIIGVAKSPVRDDDFSIPVKRGNSIHPLLVTSCGMTQQVAARMIKELYGPHRIPAMLKRADALARQALSNV